MPPHHPVSPVAGLFPEGETFKVDGGDLVLPRQQLVEDIAPSESCERENQSQVKLVQDEEQLVEDERDLRCPTHPASASRERRKRLQSTLSASEKRLARNQRERNRVKALNKAVDNLQSSIWREQVERIDQRRPRLAVLLRSVAYISLLTSVIDGRVSEELSSEVSQFVADHERPAREFSSAASPTDSCRLRRRKVTTNACENRGLAWAPEDVYELYTFRLFGTCPVGQPCSSSSSKVVFLTSSDRIFNFLKRQRLNTQSNFATDIVLFSAAQICER